MKETSIRICLLGERDIPAAIQLQKPEHWNQTERDWQRLIQLEPFGCFGAWFDAHLVGTLTTTTYGTTLAWIGMVLVDVRYRRKGIATRLLQAALDHLRQANISTVKLDATPLGQPVYESLGFKNELVIERWVGIARPSAALDGLVRKASTFRDLMELDFRAFGADRSRLLQSLMNDAGILHLTSETAAGELVGYALARERAEGFYVGPVVARDDSVARALLNEISRQLAGQRFYVDLNTTFKAGAHLLAALGFEKERTLIRMSYGIQSEDRGTSAAIFAIAAPELG